MPIVRILIFFGILFVLADEISVFGQKSFDREWIKGFVVGSILVYLLYQMPP